MVFRWSATNLCKVLAHVISRAREVVAERAGIPRLARTLTEELARDMRSVYTQCQRDPSIQVNTILDSLCFPGGLRGPSNLAIGPGGCGWPWAAPFGAPGGIFSDPVLICLNS